MSREPGAATGPATADVGPRVGSVGGYRLCESCGFQLFGSIIHRDPGLGLLVVRCPECGHVEAGSEPPRLTKRRNAGSQLVAYIWLMMKLGVLVLIVSATQLIAAGMTSASTTRYAQELTKAHEAALKDALAATDDHALVVAEFGLPAFLADPTYASQLLTYGYIGEKWIDANAAEQLERHGGRIGAVDWSAFAASGLLGLWLLPLGPLLALLLPHLRTRVLLRFAPGIIIVSLAVTLVAGYGFNTWSGFGYGYYYTSQIVEKQIGMLPAVAATAFCAVPLILALLPGRIVARAAVRILLRPELRAPFQDLWLRDGLAIPGFSRPPARPSRRQP